LSAREIGAYLSGGRSARSLGYSDLTYPELEDLAMRAATDDAPIAASMRLADYVYWYMRGYTEEIVRTWSK
jgi:hypothetical protein